MQFYIIIHTGNSCLHRGLAPRLETPSINPNPVSKNRNSINTMGTCRTCINYLLLQPWYGMQIYALWDVQYTGCVASKRSYRYKIYSPEIFLWFPRNQWHPKELIIVSMLMISQMKKKFCCTIKNLVICMSVQHPSI